MCVKNRRTAAFQTRLAKCKYDNLILMGTKTNQPIVTSACLLAEAVDKSCQLMKLRMDLQCECLAQPHTTDALIHLGYERPEVLDIQGLW